MKFDTALIASRSDAPPSDGMAARPNCVAADGRESCFVARERYVR